MQIMIECGYMAAAFLDCCKPVFIRCHKVNQVETDVEETVDYEQDLNESYEVFFQKLEDMYSEASRQDDELFRLVTDFAVKHENISFKAGMFIGFQIYKNMEEGYRGHTADSLSALASFLKEEIADKEISLEK